MDDDDNDPGMRILARGRRVKGRLVPATTLLEASPGQVVLIAVRVSAHLAGPGGGEATDTLVRAYDGPGQRELYACGDLLVRRAHLVLVYGPVDEES